ncbi:aminotransferase class I/II-fold pyridoxal phosphate-dependent enzyme [Seonamhaeicola sediminis]|uniref:Aminotransferase class I/II-fold pyridoxal phosphate-dependent enzyme n=1 Tax=Seonamhaeicola sediminis TaxID=2528206 RepID=A0A562YAC1_9FLAO|nr:methionine aminotransferase [Seonamhaeicola sediminis]TWO31353.1 aminotransferase class I/II-fold pyridoxal phosphate-dependent enzyme [Seonamhaeicola sediminis]
MQYNSKLPHVGTTIFTVMSALAKEHNAVNLSQGFPDFESDKKLINLVIKAMNSGYNHYAPMRGLLELKDTIAKKFDTLYGTTYHPENEITITAGATQAISTTITTFINRGDEVIIFQPAYDSYQPMVELNGGKVIPVQLKASNNFKVNWNDVDIKINDKTKMIIINSPHNPTGSVFSKEDMQNLEALTQGTNIIVLSDEVYEHMIFDELGHQSACLFPDLKLRTFVVASFCKTFHNTGWRIGYCCAPKYLMNEFVKVHQYSVFGIHHPTQKGIADYMQNPEHYMGLSKFYQERRDYFLDLIKESRFKFTPAKGTYFQLLDYSEITDEYDVDLAKRWTIEKQIASIPLSVFNADGFNDKVLRFCFAKKDDTLKRAADILNAI